MPELKQSELAAKLKAYFEGFVGETGPIFFHAAPSRENAEVVVAISGWKSAAGPNAYVTVSLNIR